MPNKDALPDGEQTKVKGGWLTADRVVTVTQDDIEHGKERDQWGCAIVKAIQRTNPSALRVRVNASLIGFTVNETRYTFPTPPEAVEAIIKPFDEGREVQPTTLHLRGGKMKDAINSTEPKRKEMRDAKRERKTREVTPRMAQMSPTHREYDRFGKAVNS